jgi:amino acid adenylation domain-containing protein/FkbM family methyltransferase
MQQQITQGFRLSPQQKHLWLLQRQAGRMPELAQCAVVLEGKLDEQRLQTAIAQVVKRYDVLRLTFSLLPGMNVPLQVIADVAPELEKRDLRGLDEQQQEVEIKRLLDETADAPATDAEAPALRFSLLALGAERHLLHISLPALCSDEASLENLVSEISRSYSMPEAGAGEEEVMQYVGVSQWLNELLESEDAAAGIRFWRQQDYSSLALLRLPFEQEAAADSPFEARSVTSAVEPQLAEQLARLAADNGSTLSTLLLACWQVLLHRWSAQADIIVGAAFNGRTDEELETALGLFARHLPIHARLEDETRLSEILKHLNEVVQESFEWQECFVWEETLTTGPDAQQPFFSYCFDFAPETASHTAGGLTFSTFERRACVGRFHLNLSCGTKDDSLLLEFQYDASLYGVDDITRLSGQYLSLLEQVVAAPELGVGRFEILSEDERRKLLFEFNDTTADYPQQMCLHEVVEQQAQRTPDNVAVEFAGQRLTYRELNARANQLAHYLRGAGVKPDGMVGLLAERSLEMVVGMLGILKAGGAYVPLNPTLPRERLSLMAQDARIEILLTVERLREAVPDAYATTLYLDRDWPDIAAQSEENPVSGMTADNLAYVIYTSGSTGVPKGVMISHRAICNRLFWMQAAHPLTESDSVLQKTVFNFDASIWELFLPLFAGAKVVLAAPEGHQDTAYLVNAVIEHEVTTLQMVPSMLRVLLEEPGFANCRSLKRVFCGGEALPLVLQESFYATLDADLHNLYGPTEVAIDASHWDCLRGSDYAATQGNVPIGRPLDNVQVYLLDQYLHPVPFGATGEVYVGGRGLARGYLNRPDLTAERFIPNPFGAGAGERLYRTGDLGRFLPGMAIEFMGRVDHQVKIRGFRIELGEIEAALRQHPDIKEVVALAREDDPGNQQLVAYLVPAGRNRYAEAASHGQNLYRLPNNLEIAHLNKNETDILYKEIFEDEGYLKHGITILDGDCVFDIGANIGLFTLFVHQQCRNPRVFSFEPSPPTFAVLKTNVELHDLNVKPYQCAISNEARVADFTFYPKVSASSGLYANAEEDAGVTRAFIGNQGELGSYADELLEGRFNAVTYRCQLRTVSELMRENGVEQIDLLKVDVEKSELDVLEGIEEEDWRKIRQVVMEVHDAGGRLEAVRAMLTRHGFQFVVEQYFSFENTGLYNIFAVHPSRKEKLATVVQSAENGEGHLHGLAPQMPASQDLREYLGEKLPDYMIPSVFVMLDALPLTPNGKIDRRALPAPKDVQREAEQVMAEPRTPVEELIAGVWAKVLGAERVGINSNFFDLGGHSLLATQVITRLREAFRLDIPLRTIFEAPTVAGLAKSLAGGLALESGLQAPPVQPVSREQQLPLSFAQQRLWFLDQLEPGNFFFNIPAAFRLTGSLDPGRLKETLGEVVKRHEILRTTFAEVDGEPVQVIAPALDIEIPVVDLSDLPEAEREREAARRANVEAQRPFDLARGPLFRAQLLRLGEDEHLALFTMHHIISDGWSMGVLVREVSALYEAFSKGQPSPLAALPVQYADYSVWQRAWLQGEALEKQSAYWLKQLGGKLPVLALPTDRPRPPVQTYNGTRHTLRLPEALKQELKHLGRQESVTLFMILLAAFKSLLYSYAKQEDIIVGTDVANRNKLEVEDLIGFFINQLVLRTDLSGDPTFRALLGRVRAVTLGAYAHQDLPFDKLVDVLKPERDVSRTPLFQAKFVLQNAPFKSLELPGLSLSPVEFEGGKANLDLTLFMGESEGGLIGLLEYNTDIFDAATAERMLNDFERLLTRIVAAPDVRLSELAEMLDAAERARVEAEKLKLAEASFKKFKSVKPKTVRMPQQQLVKLCRLDTGGPLPLVIEPNVEHLDLVEWARDNRALIDRSVAEHGAILFRNFRHAPHTDFDRFVQAICSDLFNENGEHPRKSLGGKVYTPIFYPPEQLLLWHNENSFNYRWPHKIWFCCEHPAREGGETPIADSRRVFELLDPRLKQRFIEKGVLYVRNYGTGLGLDWQTVFQTDDRAVVEKLCREARMEIEWKSENRARTSCVRPAAVRHPTTGEMSWFNQAQHWHLSCLDPATRESIEAVFDEEDYPRHCYYGDGTPIEDAVMTEILGVYQQSEIVFPWQAGDILMLDNILTAHARRPFAGERKLLVAMGEMRNFDEVAAATAGRAG